MTVREELLIGGEWRRPAAAARIAVVSPSTEEVIAEVPDAGPDDVDAAARAARRAFDGGAWRGLSAAERAGILERALGILESRIEEIGRLVTAEMGLSRRAGSAANSAPRDWLRTSR
ncbi:hypothetical protein GCM10010191_86910 [Actinomadura vinacea]|uniref:Aldehyde dehydrogenase domain-containing protein n=1 Tax=Actinomadura vinacea TaxID=115336 RepID=A0ABP5XFG7_9ACTN